jgi:hypothetical protein
MSRRLHQIISGVNVSSGGGGGGSLSVVQEAYGTRDDAVSSPAPLAFGSNVTSGNRIIVVLIHTYLGTPPTISDTLGNTYTVRGSHPDIAVNKFLWIFDTVSGSSGANTVTATYGAGSSYALAILEVSGSTTGYDTTAGMNSATSTSSPKSTGSITPSADGALVVGIFKEGNNTITFSSPSHTIKNLWTVGNVQTAFIWYLQTTAASIQFQVDSSSPGGGGGGGIVAYIP